MNVRVGEMAELSVTAALLEDPNLGPDNPIMWLTTNCNSSSKDIMPSYGLFGTIILMASICKCEGVIQVHINKNKIRIFEKEITCISICNHIVSLRIFLYSTITLCFVSAARFYHYLHSI